MSMLLIATVLIETFTYFCIFHDSKKKHDLCRPGYIYNSLQTGSPYGNQLASGDPVCNELYIYPGRHKSCFFLES